MRTHAHQVAEKIGDSSKAGVGSTNFRLLSANLRRKRPPESADTMHRLFREAKGTRTADTGIANKADNARVALIEPRSQACSGAMLCVPRLRSSGGQSSHAYHLRSRSRLVEAASQSRHPSSDASPRPRGAAPSGRCTLLKRGKPAPAPMTPLKPLACMHFAEPHVRRAQSLSSPMRPNRHAFSDTMRRRSTTFIVFSCLDVARGRARRKDGGE